MPFYGMMRVKNEERWLEKALRPLLKVCESVFILDDHSTDRTAEIIRGAADCVYLPSPYTTLDESRDKTHLLNVIYSILPAKEISEHSPHWVICVDGDEVICDTDMEKIMETGHSRQGGEDVVSYQFQILTLYDSPDQIRVDGVYKHLLRPSMFRLVRPNMTFFSQARHGGGFHCSNVPADIGFAGRVHEPEPVRVKHYGYMEEADRKRKYDFYTEHDPQHKDWYFRESFGEPVLAPIPDGL